MALGVGLKLGIIAAAAGAAVFAAACGGTAESPEVPTASSPRTTSGGDNATRLAATRAAGTPGAAVTPAPDTGARVLLGRETLVADRALPPDALSSEKLESAGEAADASGKRIPMARAAAGGVEPWEYVSPATDGWQVWRPKTVLDAIDLAGANATLVSAEAVDWPDACMGVSAAGQVCAQIITPGYRIQVSVGGASIEYHADRTTPGRVIRVP